MDYYKRGYINIILIRLMSIVRMWKDYEAKRATSQESKREEALLKVLEMKIDDKQFKEGIQE